MRPIIDWFLIALVLGLLVGWQYGVSLIVVVLLLKLWPAMMLATLACIVYKADKERRNGNTSEEL